MTIEYYVPGNTWLASDVGQRVLLRTSSSPLYRIGRIVQLVEPHFDARVGLCSDTVEVVEQ